MVIVKTDLTPGFCQARLDSVEIAGAAYRHGVTSDDIEHAFENAIRLVEFEYDGEDRLLVIGPDSAGRLLEPVAVPTGRPTRIIHADLLRTKFHTYLR